MLNPNLSLKLALPLLLLVALSAGCVINSDSHTERTGRQFSRETLEQVQPGCSKELVLALLDEPTSRSSGGGKTEIWKWEYHSREHRSGSFILLLDSDKTTDTSGTTYVRFEEGQVAKVWQD